MFSSEKARAHRSVWLGTSLLALMAASGARAQTAPAAQATVAEVVVTASRAGQAGFAAPTPTSVVSSDLIDRQGATNIAQVLNQIPAFKATISPANNGVRTQTPGSSNADLRGLGANRTLVLVNGMRVVPLAPANTTGVTVSPDLNQIPSLLIDRIEVVTGGASAQWGSDAVSGVVNVILKTKFEGLTVKGQTGQSELGDFKEVRLGVLAGTAFAAGRGHVVAGVDYVKNDGIGDIYTRDWGRQEYQIVANPSPAANGLPANMLVANVHASTTPGGLITGPANFSLRNFQFLPGGGLQAFSAGALAGGTFMIGGQGQSLAKGVSMAPAVRRIDPYVHVEFDLSDKVTAFAEASYAQSEGTTTVLPSRDAAITIRRDNAYLPATVGTAMDTAGIASFTMSRLNYDVSTAHVTIKNTTPHLAVGLRGALGDWTWDAHYGWGRNTYENTITGNRIRTRFAFATDAVVSGGQVVCRATLAGPSFNAAAAGCTPINLFGAGAPTEAARAYVTGVGRSTVDYTQQSAAANIKGEPLATWAGPVSVAAGVEWRSEEEEVATDPISQAGAFEAGNATAFTGSFDVSEGYVEAVVPLARDAALAKSLDFNGAVRFASYSSAGEQTTWKAGATYEPFTGLRLRATRSRDIRAPALFELYSAGSVSNQPATVRGISAVIPANVTVGNRSLTPEEADTTTLGFVIEPPGETHTLRASLDYFDINIKNAITSLSVTNVASLCSLGQTFYCNAFTFNPTTGAPTSLTLGVLNAATLQSIGYDFAVSYRAPLSAYLPQAPGSLSLSLSGTHVAHTYVNLGNGAGAIDRAGENSQLNNAAIPRRRMNLSATYSVGPASITAQVMHVSRGHLDNTFNTLPSNTINTNTVAARSYLNLYGSYNLTEDGRLQLSGGVNNVFDKDPPPAPSTTLFTPTNGAYYDTVGRAYQIGFTYRY